MQYVHINFWSVLIAAILGMAIEMAWYSPQVFGKFRAKLLESSKAEFYDQYKDNANIIICFITILITAYILSYAMFFADAATFYDGLSAAFYIWLGFVATATLCGVLWDSRPFLLYLFDNGIRLVALLLMGGILAVWR